MKANTNNNQTLHQYNEDAGHNAWPEEPRHNHQNRLLVAVYHLPEVVHVVLVALEWATA